MRETIFRSTAENPEEMKRGDGLMSMPFPQPANTRVPSADVLRTAMTPAEVRANMTPATYPVDRNVRNVERPRRGYGY